MLRVKVHRQARLHTCYGQLIVLLSLIIIFIPACVTCNIYMYMKTELVVTLEREVAICLYLDCVRTNLRGPDSKFISGGGVGALQRYSTMPKTFSTIRNPLSRLPFDGICN